MSRGGRLLPPLGAVTLAAALGAGCPSPPAPPVLTRLLPALGHAAPVTLDHVTRPATLIRFGDSRRCAIRANGPTRLRFWIGLPTMPPRGFLVVRALAEGRTLVEKRAAVGRFSRWIELAADVPPGTSALEISTALVTAGGRPLPLADEDLWVALGSPRLVRPPDRPPRLVLWISQDTLRADRLGAYGYPRPTSPVLDRLASESLLFENAMATAPWTLPSLGSQVTSLLPARHGAVWSDLARREESGVTVFEVLAEAGFTVLGASANVFFSAAHGMADGFDTLLVYSSARADHLRWSLEERLAEWDGGDLALFIHFMDPHLPYLPPPPYDKAFARAAVASTASPPERRRAAWSAAYDGEIAFTDAQIGKWLGNLDRRGLLERATILYTSDHGDELLEHGGFDHGHSLYEELVHVPLVVRLPRDRRGRRIAEPVSTLDIAPTLLAALGIESPPSFQGESLLALAAGGPRKERYLYAETQRDKAGPRLYAARRGAMKAIVGFSREAPPRIVEPRAFDLATDSGELHKLALAESSLRRAVEAYAAAAQEEGRTPRPAALGADDLQALRALGYLR